MVYFDNAASTRRCELFVEEYLKALKKRRSTLDKCRILFLMSQKISDFLGVDASCISFVPNATYALNEISIHLFDKNPNRLVCLSSSEHSSNHVVWMKFSRPICYFEAKEFGSWNVPEPSSIISLSSLTNLEGIEVSMEEIEEKSRLGHTVIVDASQMIQHKLPNLRDSEISFLVFSAHKFFGPNGIGVIYSKDSSAPQLGINHLNYREKQKDYSLDFAGLEAWSMVIDSIVERYKTNLVEKTEKELNNYFLRFFPENNYLKILNPETRSCIFLLGIISEDVSAHDYAFYLSKKGVVVRSGLSCSWLSSEKYDANKVIRVSLNVDNTRSEIDFLFDLIKNFEVLECF